MKKRLLAVENDDINDNNGRILFLKCQNQALNNEILNGKVRLQKIREELDGKRTQVRYVRISIRLSYLIYFIFIIYIA